MLFEVSCDKYKKSIWHTMKECEIREKTAKRKRERFKILQGGKEK